MACELEWLLFVSGMWAGGPATVLAGCDEEETEGVDLEADLLAVAATATGCMDWSWHALHRSKS